MCVLSPCSRDALGKRSEEKPVEGNNEKPVTWPSPSPPRQPRLGAWQRCKVSRSGSKAKPLAEKTVSLLDLLEISKHNLFFNIAEHKAFDVKWHLYGKLDERTQALEFPLWHSGIGSISGCVWMRARSLAQHSRLRIPGCHCFGIGRTCGSDVIPGPGTSMCCRAAKKERRNADFKVRQT